MDSPVDGVDCISSMPDEILHHILSFIPTKFSIRTSALSRRWMHVWCETPSLDFNGPEYYVGEINQTLSSYRASKITSFRLAILRRVPEPQIDRWIEFVVSRNVEKLSLFFDGYYKTTYRLPNFFYLSSSLEQLSIDSNMIPPGCTVSWKSLRMLTLSCCNLYDNESIANILSGSPILETLRLTLCKGLERFDVSKSHSLRRLEIYSLYGGNVPTEIVAPNIHYIHLCFLNRRAYDYYGSCTLVDVSSLAEARIEILLGTYCPEGDFLQTMVLKMLAKLQNVKRLTFNVTVLQILSVAELLGVPFPTLKVQTLTIETIFQRSVIPGIARLLQNSPELKKLIIAQATYGRHHIWDNYWDEHLDMYLDSQSKYGVFPTSVEYNHMLDSKDSMLKLMASFMEMVMTNGKILETFVVELKNIDQSAKEIWFEDLNQMTTTLSNNNNVSIVLKG